MNDSFDQQAAALDRFAAGRTERRQSEIERAAQC